MLIVADQITKWIILERVMVPPRIIPVTDFFNLVLVWNRGVSHGLFRKHFGNKEALWRAAVDFGVNRYSQAMKRRATGAHGPVSTVQDLVRVMLAVTAEHPELVRLMVAEGAARSDRSDYIAEIWHDVGDQYRGLG